MEIEVPVDLPVLSDEELRQLSTKRLCSTTAERQDFEARARLYFEAKEVVPMLNTLLTELFVSLPQDPIDHLLKFLCRHHTILELLDTHPPTSHELQSMADAAVEYSSRFKLPQLFDELLTCLLEESAEDVVRYAASWMRWHKNGFITRHVPEGYREYHENRERQGGNSK